MRCSYDSWTGNRRRRYRRWFCGYESEIFSECALTYSPKIEKKIFFNKCCFSADMAGNFGHIEFSRSPKNPFFLTFSAKYRPFLDEFGAKFFLGPFWTYFITKKIFGVFRPFFAVFWHFRQEQQIFPNFRPNLPIFGQNCNFCVFLANFKSK